MIAAFALPSPDGSTVAGSCRGTRGRPCSFRFFRRRAVGGESRPCGYIPPACPNIDEFLFLPVAERLWQQHELWDGTYTLDDLLDIVELIRIRRENEARAADAVRA